MSMFCLVPLTYTSEKYERKLEMIVLKPSTELVINFNKGLLCTLCFVSDPKIFHLKIACES